MTIISSLFTYFEIEEIGWILIATYVYICICLKIFTYLKLIDKQSDTYSGATFAIII